MKRDFKVALIGSSGLLGRAVAQELRRVTNWQVVTTTHSRSDPASVKLDIRDSVAVASFMESHAPDAVVVAAAERRPDVCERQPELARALNVDAVRAIGEAAR